MTGNEEKTSNRFPSANCVIVAAATVLSCPYYVYITITIDYYLDRYITKIDYIHRLHQIDNIYRLHRQITQIDYTRYITQIDYTRQITYQIILDRLLQITIAIAAAAPVLASPYYIQNTITIDRLHIQITLYRLH